MLKGNGIWFAIAGLVLAMWVRNWAKTSSAQGASIFTGITPQRGIFGTDGTPVADPTNQYRQLGTCNAYGACT